MLLHNHHSITAVPEVTQICLPLFNQTEISHYVHARVFDNGGCYSLVTHADQQLHHFKNKYKVTPPIPEKILKKRFYYFITENDGPFQPVLYDFKSLFNLWHPFFIIERFENYYDLSIFFSPPTKVDMLAFYLNNLEMLEKFNLFFTERAAPLIQEAQKSTIQLSEEMRPNFGGLLPQETYRNEIFAFNSSCENFFSKRESECLKLLSYGLTVKEIAKNLNISPRTVEDYINSLKLKLKVNRKSEILSAFNKLNSYFNF